MQDGEACLSCYLCEAFVGGQENAAIWTISAPRQRGSELEAVCCAEGIGVEQTLSLIEDCLHGTDLLPLCLQQVQSVCCETDVFLAQTVASPSGEGAVNFDWCRPPNHLRIYVFKRTDFVAVVLLNA